MAATLPAAAAAHAAAGGGADDGTLLKRVLAALRHASPPALAAAALALLFCAYYVAHRIHAARARRAWRRDPASRRFPSPELRATLLQRLTFGWFDAKIEFAQRRAQVDFCDLWELAPPDATQRVNETLARIKAGEQRESRGRRRLKQRSLVARLFLLVWRNLAIQAAFALVGTALALAPPFFLNRILAFISGCAARTDNAAACDWDVTPYLVGGLFLSTVLKTVCDGQTYFNGRRIGTRVRAALIGETYAKSLRRVLSTGDEAAKLGEITNLMAVDTQKIVECSCYLHYVWSTPSQVLVTIYLLFRILGLAGLVGCAIMICMIPAGGILGKLVSRAQKDLMKSTDSRVNKLTETLDAIRIIKFFSWETLFLAQLEQRRAHEVAKLRRYLAVAYFSRIVWYSTPIAVTLATFWTLTANGGELTPTIAFTSLALFNTLRHPLQLFPDIIVRIMEARVGLGRIQTFLDEEDVANYRVEFSPSEDESDITISGSFQFYVNEAAQAAESSPPTSPSSIASSQTLSPSGSATTATTTEKTFKLDNVALSLPRHKLTIVIGPTGSGKTALLMALLGELQSTSESSFVRLPSLTVAYVAQHAWLQNATIRDNIVFGGVFDRVKYDKVVDACDLVKDLALFDAGDLTEIGERGVNLSGGQKQRIALARALYNPAEVVILDDPFSAVDAQTGRNLLQNAVQRVLIKEQRRTVVLVTHAVKMCTEVADKVVVVKRGKVVAQGAPSEIRPAFLEEIEMENQEKERAEEEAAKIIQNSKKPVVNGLSNSVTPSLREMSRRSSSDMDMIGDEVVILQDDDKVPVIGDNAGDADTDDTDDTDEDAPLLERGRLVQTEVRAQGSVKSRIYWEYLRSAGGYAFICVFFFSFVLTQTGMVSQDVWIKVWSNTYHSSKAHAAGILDGVSDTSFYLQVYLLLNCATVLSMCMRFIVQMGGSLCASKSLHTRLLARLMRAPIRFFDSTPSGRILNRLGKDMQSIDQELMNYVADTISNFCSAVAILFVVFSATPAILALVVPVGAAAAHIGRRYLRVSRDLKRLDSVSRSPIYSLFSETLQGVCSIRAFKAQDRFVKLNYERIDNNHRAFFYLWVSNRWLSIRVDFLGAFVALFSASAIMLLVYVGAPLDVGLAGLSLSYALLFTDSLLWLLRIYALVEMHLNSVERIEEYMLVEQEKPAVVESNRPPADWPSKGEIVFDKLVMSYSKDASVPPVLRDISFTVRGGEKLAIVGRTGSGKSTLVQALFRMMEPVAGTIAIDGVDILGIGLADLRSRLMIIPQDPVLFEGTVRSNLDIFGKYDDLVLNDCLDRVGLISRWVSSNADDGKESDGKTAATTRRRQSSATQPRPDRTRTSSSLNLNSQEITLDMKITDQGKNLSSGQRQLLCFCRSIISRARVIVLDEATSSVDHDTDARIQRVLRSEFGHSTILCIAHRLRTVIDFDRVVVLEKGSVREIGTPRELLVRGSGSLFRTMCEESGELDLLIEMARK